MKIGYFTKIRYSIILGITLIGAAVRLYVFNQMDVRWHIAGFFIQFLDITIIWEGIRILNNYLNKKIPFQTGVTHRIIVQSILIVIIAIIIIFPALKILEKVAPFPLNGPYKVVISLGAVMYIMTLNLAYIGAYFFDQWKESALLSSALEKEKATVQYQNLINQLNPHFFFNSLTSLNSLIYKDQQLASDFLQQLSKVYRYMLENKTNELVTLAKELQFAESYILLLQTRFGSSICVELHINKESMQKMIVPVTLQIMIENAVKHNVIDIDYPLSIKIYDMEGFLWVENNLQTKNSIENSNKIGLENFKNLYSHLTDVPVIIQESAQLFVVKIPLI